MKTPSLTKKPNPAAAPTPASPSPTPPPIKQNWLSRPASATQITHANRLWLYALATLIILFLVIPTLIVIPMSFSDSQYLEFPPRQWSQRWYDNYFYSREWMTATWVSIQAALLTVLLITPIATAAAYGLAVSRWKATRPIYVLLLTPMMVPVILIAIGVFFAYTKIRLNNTMLGLVLAHSVLALPMCLVVLSAGLRSYDMNQELVARSLGASRLKAFLLITLPQIRFSVITAALLAFIVSLDEVIVALFITGGKMSTITRSMFLALRDQIDPTIAAISTIMILITSLALILTQLYGKNRDQHQP